MACWLVISITMTNEDRRLRYAGEVSAHSEEGKRRRARLPAPVGYELT